MNRCLLYKYFGISVDNIGYNNKLIYGICDSWNNRDCNSWGYRNSNGWGYFDDF